MSMGPDALADHFAAWHDEDLVRGLKLDRADYESAYLDSIAAELARRKVDPEAFVDRVEVSHNAAEPAHCTIAQALDKPSEDFPLWHALAFTHYFGATLVVQRELRSWLVNAYEGQVYTYSFFIADRATLLDLLRRFLTMGNWDELVGQSYNLDSWKPLLRARSGRYVQKVAEVLADADQPFTVQTPVFTGDQRGQLALLVPDRPPAETILHQLQDHLLDLYAQAEMALSENALSRELTIYAELADYGLNNPAVYYNLGSALAESGRYPKAATAFIEAASLSLAELDAQVHFQARKGPGGLGGLFGMVGMLVSAFKSDDQQAATAQREVPDHVEDIELQLLRLLDHLPQDLQILHSLAAIAAIRHDVPRAVERYRQILALAPADETAQSYLAEQEAQ
jgi:tetratricopeptide (TPR) repeat protein